MVAYQVRIRVNGFSMSFATFSSRKKALAYAVKILDTTPDIQFVEISEPGFRDVWEWASNVTRMPNGRYLYNSVKPMKGKGLTDGPGDGHYVNKDGSFSKDKRW